MVIVQISDLHIGAVGKLAYGRLETGRCLARCVERICGMRPRPDLVLATGDLVEEGRPEEYRRLSELLAPLPMPVFLIPGNHDNRELLARELKDHVYLPRDSPFLHYAIDRYPLRLIGLDTVIPSDIGGLICEERLAWLASRLEEAPERPTLIFMHHPPFVTGIVSMDTKGLRGADEIGKLIDQHPQVERILCGHLHRPIHVRWRGTIASTAPSTAYQLLLDLDPRGPSMFVLEPPAFSVHLWQPDTGLISHTSYIDLYPGPYRFHEEETAVARHADFTMSPRSLGAPS